MTLARAQLVDLSLARWYHCVIPIAKSEPLSIGKAEPLEDLGPIRKTRRVPSYCSARGERRGSNWTHPVA